MQKRYSTMYSRLQKTACSSSLKHGFTLIELSIVLVIIGLIIGGVLAGKSMIRNAELRSIIADLTSYRIAYNTYRLKYNAPPGDDPQAESYFGAATTNNGNGSGNLASATNAELFLLWQHLSLAGLISGTYTGLQGAGGIADTVIGQNIPMSKVGGAGYFCTGSKELGLCYVGADSSTAMFFNTTGFISPLDTKTLDTKTDDGIPITGNLQAADSLNPARTCLSGGEYSIATAGNNCWISVISW